MTSKECRQYAEYATRQRQKEPFPIEKLELLNYIRYRGRSRVFCNYLTNLHVHPLHGRAWLNKMNKVPEVIGAMQRLIKIWHIDYNTLDERIIGIDLSAGPDFYEPTSEDDAEFKRIREYEKGPKHRNTPTQKTGALKTKELKFREREEHIEPEVYVNPFPNVFKVAGQSKKVGFIAKSLPTKEEVASNQLPLVSASVKRTNDVPVITKTPARPIRTLDISMELPSPPPEPESKKIIREKKSETSHPPSKPTVKKNTLLTVRSVQHPFVFIERYVDEKKESKGKKRKNRSLSPDTGVEAFTSSTRYREEAVQLDPEPEVLKEFEICNLDEEFTQEVYEAYLHRQDLLRQREKETGIKIVEPTLMVLSKVEIEKYE